jgi:hypothetical protein
MPCQIATSSVTISLHHPRFNKNRGEPKSLCCFGDDDDDDDDDAKDEECKF